MDLEKLPGYLDNLCLQRQTGKLTDVEIPSRFQERNRRANLGLGGGPGGKLFRKDV